MREISQETQEILKSQKMLGQNKFSYDLKLEGYEAGYGDINETLTNTVNSSALWADYCIRGDGKVLYAYLSGVSIYLKIIETEEIMLADLNAGAGGDLFYTMQEISMQDCFSLLRLKDGKILLFINDAGELNGSPSAFKVYKSSNGLGTDFALVSTISTSARINSGLGTYLKNFVSKGAQDKDGSIWIFGGVRASSSGYDVAHHDVYKSNDGGITWLRKYRNIPFIIQGAYYFNPKNLVIVGNVLFITVRHSQSNHLAYVYISFNAGETWSQNISNFQSIPTSRVGYFWHELIDFHYDGYNLFMIYGVPGDFASLFVADVPDVLTYEFLDTASNWRLIKTGIPRYAIQPGILTVSPRGIIHFTNRRISNEMIDTGMIRELYSAPFPASSISISKGKGGANSLSVSVDNTKGAYNPKNPESPLYGILNLNKQIIVKQGYGSDLIETFTGMIDSFSMKSYPHTMEISCRDNLKKALDQTITEFGQNTVNFDNQPIENIFGYLCYLGGIETGEIDTTGISISKEFSWQTYADAFQFLADMASFDYGADEYGKIYFKRDYQPDEIFIAYTFEEGLDITSLSYQLEDKDLYYKVKVYGKSGDNVISYSALFPDAAKYNILPQKILKVDATEAGTLAELQKIADRSIYLMNSRTAIVNFAAVAVPWLQVGDFIQVNESSSMSAGIYRISSLNLKMTDKDFTMDLQCYYYGDSVDVGTLPEDTATQTGNAALNLIPEMTSNTVPSGVARASSVLTLYDNDYGPWNALNSTSDDLYWNAVSQYGWIEYQFTEKTIIDKYMLKARQAIDYNKAMPKNWQFEGFDGEKWIVLDTRSNQTAWQIHEERSFNFTNTIAYAKYRLNVSANNGFHRLQLEQLAMYYRGGA